MIKLRPAALLTLAMAISASAATSDWPQWRGPTQTGHVPAGVPVPATLPAECKSVWKIPIGEGFASPVVSGGKVFWLDNKEAKEVAHAADAATGKELWNTVIFESHKDGFGIGPRCPPTVDGNLVFVQSCKGEFQCLNAADGKKIWSKNFVTDFGAIYIGEKGLAAGASRHGNNGAPVVDGENVIVEVGSPKDASVVCFKKATGEVVWHSQPDQSGYAPAVVATIAGIKHVVAFTIDGVIGLDAKEGKLLWRVPLKTTYGRHVTTPLISDDLVIVASHMVGLVATKIVKDGSGVKAEPAWTNKDMKINFSSPVAVGGYLYGLGPAKNVVCIDLKTGTVVWEKTGNINSAPDKAFAGFLVFDKNILMLNDTGQIILFAADPKEYKELGRVQVCGNNWCNPAYVDGKLFLRDAKELQCVEIGK
jgi:outer membrane protein assembly factor BamB